MIRKTIIIAMILFAMSCKQNIVDNKELSIPQNLSKNINFKGLISNFINQIKNPPDSLMLFNSQHFSQETVNKYIDLDTPYAIIMSTSSKDLEKLYVFCSKEIEFENFQHIHYHKDSTLLMRDTITFRGGNKIADQTFIDIYYKINYTLNGRLYNRVWYIGDKGGGKISFWAYFLYFDPTVQE
jgi:hypothetical protein